MKRRDFLTLAAGLGAGMQWPALARAADLAPGGRGGNYRNLLILVELKGGNDGLNTVIPYADPLYASLRPKLAIPRAQVLQLDERAGLHPAMASLLPMWRQGEVAIVEGVSYPTPNLSHFRSIEIWDTGSAADEYLRQGWLTRVFTERAVPPGFATDGVVIGSAELGPLGNGARAITLVNPEQFLHEASLPMPARIHDTNPALEHILTVENDLLKPAGRLRSGGGPFAFKTSFPPGTFGASVQSAMQVVAATDAAGAAPGQGPGGGVAVLRLTLNGFDTHQNQLAQQGHLLEQLAGGMVAMRAALQELGRWQSTLIMTYSEFGRRARENQSAGTDHGTAAPHFVAGGRVKGGRYGVPPALAQLDGNGNLPVGVDFRALYATVLERWWGMDSAQVLERGFEPMSWLQA